MFPYYLWFAVLLLAAAVPQFLLAWRRHGRLSTELAHGTLVVVCLCEALAWVDFDAYLRDVVGLLPSELFDELWREHGWWFVESSGVVFVCSLWIAFFAPPVTRRPLDGPMKWRASACVLVTALAIVLGHLAGFIRPLRLWTAMEFWSRSGVFGGLQVAVQSLEREGDKLQLGYTFRLVGKDRSFGFPWQASRIRISFTDADGNIVASDSSNRVLLSKKFLLPGERANVVEGLAEVDIPEGAKFVTIELLGIVSRPVAIPE